MWVTQSQNSHWLVVSGGSCTLVAMTTPHLQCREACQTGLFVPSTAKGRVLAIGRAGVEVVWAERNPGRMGGWQLRELLQGTGK